MTKLDGNNRWQTKMMLTEHVEALQQREIVRPPVNKGQPTQSDLAAMKTSILLPMIQAMVDKTMFKVSLDQQSLRMLFERALTLLHARVGQDILINNRDLNQRQIKLWKERQEEVTIYYRYVCRGVEGEFGIDRSFAKQSIANRISEYIDTVIPNPKSNKAPSSGV